MHFLDVLVWIATIGGFCLTTICLAGSLYYLAELVEEYTVLAKKTIKVLTVAVAVIHVLLWILDGFPFLRVAFSLVCLGVYSLLLREFPLIELLSPSFISSCVLVVINHIFWFQYFSNNYYRFAEVMSFFGICVWLIPFSYFISLSANDNTLPMDNGSSDEKRRTSRMGNRLLAFFKMLLRKKDELLPSSTKTNKSI